MDAPTAFAVESFTNRSVTLKWTDAAGAVFYRLYFGETSVFANATLFCPILQGVGRAIIGALQAETQYWFWIVAEDALGGLSVETSATCTTKEEPGEDFAMDVVQKAIYDWAVDNFGDYAVIWEKTNGPKPGKPFATLDIKSSAQFGGQDHVREGARLCGNRALTVSVNVYSNSNPWQMAMDMRTSLQLPNVVDFFDGMNIGIGEVGGVTDLSQLLDNSNWEQRAQFDFEILVASDKAYDVGQISEVDFKNNL